MIPHGNDTLATANNFVTVSCKDKWLRNTSSWPLDLLSDREEKQKQCPYRIRWVVTATWWRAAKAESPKCFPPNYVQALWKCICTFRYAFASPSAPSNTWWCAMCDECQWNWSMTCTLWPNPNWPIRRWVCVHHSIGDATHKCWRKRNSNTTDDLRSAAIHGIGVQHKQDIGRCHQLDDVDASKQFQCLKWENEWMICGFRFRLHMWSTLTNS